MNYTNKVKYIIDNYNFTSCVGERYSYNGKKIAGESQDISDIFSSEFYKINGTNHTFHNKEMVNFLSEYKQITQLPLNVAINSEEKTILQLSLHTCTQWYNGFEVFKKYLFDKLFENKKLLEKMRSGNLLLVLNQGHEAENFIEKTTYTEDLYKNHYDLFESVVKEYKIPINSILILSSNLFGDEKDSEVNVLYDNIWEVKSFDRALDLHSEEREFDIEYSFDEYVENIKKSKTPILRLNRTPHQTRDTMLYYLYSLGYNDKSITEHKEFIKSHLTKDNDIVNKIKSDLPLVASDIEKRKKFGSMHTYSNKPIPYDIYKESIFSWVSVSLPDQKGKVFLNQSTFNPILHYHPILWFGHKHTIKNFKKFGYKSYDWLFEENEMDNVEHINNRMELNIRELKKVMNMSRDELVNRIIDNRDTLEHNRNLLFECKSIERIITRIYETAI